MPNITLHLKDTPDGGVDITSDYKPTVGGRCSLAQAAALEIMARTRANYGMPTKPKSACAPAKPTASTPTPCCASTGAREAA